MKTAKYSLKEIKPNIFYLEFQDRYDLCMHFLRYQEFYESSSPKFRNKSFSILVFMRWYSKKYGNGSFTYPNDWNGFNLPGEIIAKVHNLTISDHNIYDYEMLNIYRHCKKSSQDFYLIGALKKDKDVLNHELAHGFWFVNSEYKKKMMNLVNLLPESIKSEIFSTLKELGYSRTVFKDETQAYLSTGITKKMSQKLKNKNIKKYSKQFEEIFNLFNKM
jgi:hypothetical protein